jgi:DNA invertase Pin-like site-specific DNA recombinase
MRAIIYCRVSTDRQVKQGASLEVQRKAAWSIAKSRAGKSFTSLGGFPFFHEALTELSCVD